MNENAIFLSTQPSDILNNIDNIEIETGTDKNLNENRISYMQICALLTKFKELQDEKGDLENRFTNENARFLQLVEKLKDRLRLLALSTLEMEGKIRILNNKVPELENRCDRQNKTIDEIIYKLKTSSTKEIKALEKTINNTENDIKHLENEVLKMKKKNKELKTEFDSLTQNSVGMKNTFESDQQALKDNIANLEHDNWILEKKLNLIVDVNKDTYIQRIHSLEKELDTITTEIKRTKNEKISLMGEMTTLKREVNSFSSQQVEETD